MDYLEIEFEPDALTRFSEVELKGSMGDPTGAREYSTLSSEPQEKWKSTLANPLRKEWCRRYLRFLGNERLEVMGYDGKQIIGELASQPTNINQFLPDLNSIPPEKLRRAKTLVINYPNNPTGASATPEFFASVVAFAKKNNLIVIHDAAYAALVFGGKPLSFLATPGAMDIGLELHSMSKGFNMTGWRLGFVAGHPQLVRAYADVKDNTDSGQFLAIQEACAYALDHPQITEKIAAKYSRRMDGLVTVLNRHNLPAKKPGGSFFLYVKSPRSAQAKNGDRVTFERAEHFSQWLIAEKLISTVPWDDAGAYVRFSVTFNAKDEKDETRVLTEINHRLTNTQFTY